MTLSQAFLIALFFCMILWAILWGAEASFYRKSCEYADYILSFTKTAFDESNIAVYFETKTGRHYASALFSNILSAKSKNKLRENILEIVKDKASCQSWPSFLLHLEFQSQAFTTAFTLEGQIYRLSARALENNVFFWITLLKAPESDLILAKRVIDNLPIPIWYRNRDGFIMYCNQVYAGVLEKTVDDIIAENLEIISPKRASSPFQLTQKAFETGAPQMDRGHAILGGARRLLEVGVVPFKSGESMGFAFDLNEVEVLQKEIQRGSEGQQQIIQQLSTPIAIYGSDTRLQLFNDAYMHLFNFKESFLLEKPTLGAVLEDLRGRRKLPELPNFQSYKRERMQLFQTLLNPRQELLHLPEGKIFRMCISPYAQGGLFYVFEDMSEKIGLEQKYNTLIAVQKETIDNLYEGIVVFGSNHRLQLMNQSFIRIFKINEPDWFFGKNLTEVIEASGSFLTFHSQDLYQEILQLFGSRFHRENQVMLSDKRVLKYAYFPLPDGSHLISIIDVTDTVRFQDALKERNRILEETDELKSRFIKDVAYEVQSPLHFIREKIQDAKRQENPSLPLEDIDRATQHLITNLTDMLDLASIEAGQLTLLPLEISVPKFMKSIVGLVSQRVKAVGIDVKSSLDQGSLTFKGDEKRLKQAFFNILSSALRLRLSQEVGSLKNAKIHFKVEKQEVQNVSHLVFSLHYAGFSIKKSEKRKLQKLLYHPSSEDIKAILGTDMGFSFVRRIIELHNGWIRFEASGEEESLILLDFYCYLPLQETAGDVDFAPSFQESA